MEIFRIVIDFLGTISWPVSAFAMLFLALHALRKGWINSLKAWHKDSGLEVSTVAEELVNSVQRKTKKLSSEEAAELKLEFERIVAKRENGSNSNGEYWGTPNGTRAAKIKVNFDGSKSRVTYTYPCAFNTDCLQVTFWGDIQPRITKMTSIWIELEVPYGTKGEATMCVFGL